MTIEHWIIAALVVATFKDNLAVVSRLMCDKAKDYRLFTIFFSAILTPFLMPISFLGGLIVIILTPFLIFWRTFKVIAK